ncbi:MAG: division/cell wall cluster transcriptional repressor MraZ [Gemmataceae bacterium]
MDRRGHSVLLTGTHRRALDDKKRLTLPKKVREVLGEPLLLYIAPGPDKCLWLHTERELERLASRLDERPATDAEARLFRRLYFGQTDLVEVDKAGRILVPERLAKLAGLAGEVVLLGVRDHLELWDAGHWDRYCAENEPRFDAVAQGAFEPKGV